jgi:hypothetical protein
VYLPSYSLVFVSSEAFQIIFENGVPVGIMDMDFTVDVFKSEYESIYKQKISFEESDLFLSVVMLLVVFRMVVLKKQANYLRNRLKTELTIRLSAAKALENTK